MGRGGRTGDGGGRSEETRENMVVREQERTEAGRLYGSDVDEHQPSSVLSAASDSSPSRATPTQASRRVLSTFAAMAPSSMSCPTQSEG